MPADQPPVIHLRAPAQHVRTWRSPRLHGAHDIIIKRATINGSLAFGDATGNVVYLYGSGVAIRISDGARRFTVRVASTRATPARVRITYRVAYHRFTKS